MTGEDILNKYPLLISLRLYSSSKRLSSPTIYHKIRQARKKNASRKQNTLIFCFVDREALPLLPFITFRHEVWCSCRIIVLWILHQRDYRIILKHQEISSSWSWTDAKRVIPRRGKNIFRNCGRSDSPSRNRQGDFSPHLFVCYLSSQLPTTGISPVCPNPANLSVTVPSQW